MGKPELLQALNQTVRRMGIHTVLFHQALAEQFGLGATDSRTLSILEQTGPLTAGGLAELTGLSTGAITATLDRLEKGGWVRRMPDARDRRKVIVETVRDPERDRAMRQKLEPLQRNFQRLAGDYGEPELAVILEFIQRATDMMQQQTRELRNAAAD